MAFISKIVVRGLFGLYDHEVAVRAKPRVTIIAGPNGIGKTTLLGLTQSLLTGGYRELSKHEFSSLTVRFEDESEIEAVPIQGEDDAAAITQFHLKLNKRGGVSAEAVIDVPVAAEELALPPYVEPRGPETFLDTRLGELLSFEEAQMRYGRLRGARTPTPQLPWQEQEGWRVDFIETKRLDTLMAREAKQPRGGGARRREAESAPINTYLRRVHRTLESARVESTRIRQKRDRNFVKRLLDKKASRANVDEARLRVRYRSIEEEAQNLATNGLLTDSLDILPKTKLNPTEKRIINLFLDDFEAKLKPLRPSASKVENFRAIIDSKFLNKSIQIDPVDGIFFHSEPTMQTIAPESLSSGEQHQLALISRLLFSEMPGTTVLVDEPELSLHVSWQHEMVDDLAQIARLADTSFILATHSTAIINGRWDLVDELGPISDTREKM